MSKDNEPSSLPMGTRETFRQLCDGARLTGGPGDPVGRRGGGGLGSAIGVPVVAVPVPVAPAIAPEELVPVVPVPAVDLEEGVNLGPSQVRMGDPESFRRLCDGARLIGGPGVPAAAVGLQVIIPVIAPVIAPVPVPAFIEDLIIEEDSDSEGVNIGPSQVRVGDAESFERLCEGARLHGGPGHTAAEVGERGGRNLGPLAPLVFFVIVSLMLSGARALLMTSDDIPSELEKSFNLMENLTTGAKYRNLMVVDEGARAMSVASHEKSEVDADEVFDNMLLKSELGTTLGKDGEKMDELCDRDTKQGSNSRLNWGMFYPNMTQKDTVNFSGSATIGSGKCLFKMMVVGGLVFATSAVLLLQ